MVPLPQYVIALGHRSSWQDVGVILQSKADVASFCLELAKKLNMRYTAPPLPVDLNVADASNIRAKMDQNLVEGVEEMLSITSSSPTSPTSPDVRSISALFKKTQ